MLQGCHWHLPLAGRAGHPPGHFGWPTGKFGSYLFSNGFPFSQRLVADGGMQSRVASCAVSQPLSLAGPRGCQLPALVLLVESNLGHMSCQPCHPAALTCPPKTPTSIAGPPMEAQRGQGACGPWKRLWPQYSGST